MKILLTIYSLEIGGAQTFVIRLANELAKNHEVTIFDHNPQRSGKKLISNISPKVRIVSFNPNPFFRWIYWKINAVCKIINPNFSFWEWKKHQFYLKTIPKINPNIVNSHSLLSDQVFCNAKFDYPLVCSMHGEYEMSLEQSNNSFEHTHIFEKAKYFILASDKNKIVIDMFKNKFDIKHKKIYYGYSPSEFVPKIKSQITDNPNALIFGVVARDLPEKGWEQTIIAFQNLQKKYPHKNTNLVLVGEGDYLDTLYQKYGKNQSIKFVGFSKNPLEWVSIFDVGILATYFKGESLPNTIIEYLYGGKAVIATNIGDIKNMLESENGTSGTLIELNDHNQPNISDIETAMENYLNDEKLLEIHQKNAYLAFKKFDMKLCVEEYLKIYETYKTN